CQSPSVDSEIATLSPRSSTVETSEFAPGSSRTFSSVVVYRCAIGSGSELACWADADDFCVGLADFVSVGVGDAERLCSVVGDGFRADRSVPLSARVSRSLTSGDCVLAVVDSLVSSGQNATADVPPTTTAAAAAMGTTRRVRTRLFVCLWLDRDKGV